MHSSVLMVGKLLIAPVPSATVSILTHSRLFVYDQNLKTRFLVDSGAALSCFARSLTNRKKPDTLTLSAANGTVIPTYGTIRLELDFGFKRKFPWTFVVADISCPILGADFLEQFGLIVDIKNKRIMEGLSDSFSPGVVSGTDVVTNITPIALDNPYNVILSRYPKLISGKLNIQPIKHSVTHFIETTGSPVFNRPRRLSVEKLTALKKEFKVLLEQGIIRPSKSSWASPIHMVKKSDGSYRVCGDYRRLNAVTIPDRYPLPHIHDFVLGLRDKRIFSKIDLVKAYHQIPLEESSIQKSAVTTPIGLFEYTRMTFGLRNAAQSFQRFIDCVIRDLECCYAYVDDLLIASKDAETHEKDLASVFQRLSDFGIVINLKKCILGQSQLPFLGYMVSTEGVSPLPDKVEVLKKFPLPRYVCELRRFLAILNFYHRFMKNAAVEQAVLHDMIKGKCKKSKSIINWTDPALKAFKKCKDLISNATTLAFPRADAQLSLQVDASDVAAGAVLHQLVQNKLEPLGFFSKKFSGTEVKYSTFDRELLAIFMAVKHFKHTLEGRELTVYTDHKPLVYAFSQKQDLHSPRQIRHLQFISQFTTDLRHIAGKDNVVADALSRVFQIDDESIDFALLARDQSTDEDLETLLESSSLDLKAMPLDNTDQPLYCDVSAGKVRPYIPKQHQRRIFDVVHKLSHPGVKTTLKLIRERFVWKNMNRDIKMWCQACMACQRSKISRHIRSPLQHYPLPPSRFARVHIDVVGPLPLCKGKSYLLTCIDRYTRWPEAYPMEDQTAETVSRTFLDGWVSRFGAPEVVTTDRGTNFEGHVFNSMLKYLGTSHARTTAYNPKCNGIIERFHRSLKSALMAHQPELWINALPLVLLGFRCSVKEDLGLAPVHLVYGSPLRLPGEFFQPSIASPQRSIFVKNLMEQMQQIRPVATSWHVTPRTFVFKNLQKCSHVFLRRDGVSRALQAPYDGPFHVIERTNKTLTLEVRGKKVKVSIDRVKPAYIEDDRQESGMEQMSNKSQQNDMKEGFSRYGRRYRPVIQFSA